MAVKDGGPAFPQHLIETRDGAIQASYDAPDGAGLSLRDYFAAQALAGLLAQGTEGTFSKAQGVEMAAAYAYEYADAMLKAREKSDRGV